MAEKILEERVAALEAQMLGKNLQEHFRDQAELIDRMFAYRFEEFDKKWDAKLDIKLDSKLGTFENSLQSRLESKLEAKLEAKLEPLRSDLVIIKDALRVILTRLP
jgi:hypothetical protein